MRVFAVLVVAGLVAAGASAQFQPTDADFDDLVQRTGLAEAGDLETAQRVLRFVQVSDAHIIDDDAPPPMRVEFLDPLGEPFTSAQRPQEEFTDEMLNSMIAKINQVHLQDRADFVINTGDNIDNQLENELMRFIDNWEGTFTTEGPFSGLTCVPDGQSESVADQGNDMESQCTHLPESVAANNTALVAGLPWFSAFGNHDGLIQGNVPIEPSFQELADEYGRQFIEHDDYVSMHFRAGDSCPGDAAPAGDVFDDWGHGFGFAGERLCDESVDNDGYYAFDLRGVRILVLDTVNDDFVTANENLQGSFVPQGAAGYDLIGGYASGAIDPVQYDWMLAEVDAHADKLVLLMSHHTINSWFTDQDQACCGPNGESLETLLVEAGYRTSEELMADLADRPNVIAWIGGHTHKHRIEAKTGDGISPGFWNVETSSVIDRPHEARVIELWVSGDKGFLTTKSIAQEFALGAELAGTDDDHPDASGEDVDQEVLLWFDIPSGVAVTPQPSLPRFMEITKESPAREGGVHGKIGDNLTLAYSVRDSQSGDMLADLELHVLVTHTGDDGVHQDLDAPLADVGAGRYETTFTPTEGGTHFVTVIATDPQGVLPQADRVDSIVIEAEDIETTKGKDSPGLGLVALLGVLLLARQKR